MATKAQPPPKLNLFMVTAKLHIIPRLPNRGKEAGTAQTTHGTHKETAASEFFSHYLKQPLQKYTVALSEWALDVVY